MRNFKYFFWPLLSVFLLTIIVLPCICTDRKFVIRNSTDSLPHGFYAIRPASTIKRGDIACFPIPPTIKQLVVHRRWLRPDGFFLKPVVALPGDHVRLNSDSFTFNHAEEPSGYVMKLDSKGRPMPTTYYRGHLSANTYFVAITDKRDSLDSRYFGPIHKSEIIGVATPLWIF